MRDLYIEQAVKLQVKVLAVDVAVGELGDDGLQRVVELAPALEVLRFQRVCLWCNSSLISD